MRTRQRKRWVLMWEDIKRSTVCWAWGHRIRFAGRWLGPGKGYRYFRSDRHRYRCDRCKSWWAEHPDLNWWRQVEGALGNFCGVMRVHRSCYQKRDEHWYQAAPWYVRWPNIIVGGILHGFADGWLCYIRFLPSWPGTLAYELYSSWYDWIEPRHTYYYWARTEDQLATTGEAEPWEPWGCHWRKNAGPPPKVWRRVRQPVVPTEPGTYSAGAVHEWLYEYPEAA